MDRNAQIEELLTRGVAEIIGRDRLKGRLLAGEKLRVKFGIDPTSPNIHLGRAVVLRKLRDFQDVGCEVHFIIGDFTGQIGDTSDKESERPMLSETAVNENLKTYLEQAYKILDKTKTTEHRNSSWLSGLTLKELSELATWFSLHEFIARDNIKKRLDEGKRISLREVLYPLMQGYDSLMVDADVEIGGTDQRFNMLAGRVAQQYYLPSAGEQVVIRKNISDHPKERWGQSTGENPQPDRQYILTMNLILGTDGRKMSSSWGNTINVLDTPNDMFGKVMSIPDELIMEYFVHCTRVPMAEVEALAADIAHGANPRDAKLRLGREIVIFYHGVDAATQAERYFIETFSHRRTPENIPEARLTEPTALIELLVQVKFASSKGEARRKIEQGGIEIDGEKVSDWKLVVTAEHSSRVLKVGKKDFVKIVF